MKSLVEIKSILAQYKEYLYQKYPIRSLAIFGSYSRNEQQEGSDVDLLVEFNGRVGIRFIDLANELEVLLQQKVDLVSAKGIKHRYLRVIKPDLIYV
ncbi:MAG: nucleotidyltransferase family protein [Cyclobacteriaceae bacterium]